MPADPDVLVVGGGVAGLFCAYHLRRRGLGVTVVERGPIGGPQSCSAGNTGFVGTHGAAPLAQSALRVPPHPDGAAGRWLRHFRAAGDDRTAQAAFRVLVELKKRSLAVLRELAAGGLAGSVTEPGMLLLYRTAAGFEAAARTVPAAVASGVPLRRLEPGELAALEPGVDFAVHGGLVNPEGAAVHVPGFVIGLARLLAGAGVEIHPDTEVLDFAVAGDRVREVRTSRGRFRPAQTVLAAGAWTAAQARLLGVGIELQPVKGYSVTVRAPARAPRRPVLLGEDTVALLPLADRLRAAGGLQLAGFDPGVDGGEVDRLLGAVHAFLPGLGSTPTVEVWSGFRPCTPDSVPLLGRPGAYRNVTLACGYGHIGMGLAPAAGEVAARVVTGEATAAELAPFHPDRFGPDRSLGPVGPVSEVAPGNRR